MNVRKRNEEIVERPGSALSSICGICFRSKLHFVNPSRDVSCASSLNLRSPLEARFPDLPALTIYPVGLGLLYVEQPCGFVEPSLEEALNALKGNASIWKSYYSLKS